MRATRSRWGFDSSNLMARTPSDRTCALRNERATPQAHPFLRFADEPHPSTTGGTTIHRLRAASARRHASGGQRWGAVRGSPAAVRFASRPLRASAGGRSPSKWDRPFPLRAWTLGHVRSGDPSNPVIGRWAAMNPLPPFSSVILRKKGNEKDSRVPLTSRSLSAPARRDSSWAGPPRGRRP